MTLAAIESCRRIGRDEVARSTTIGLAEFDALCDLAEEALRHREIVEAARAWLAQEPELRRSGEIDLANAIEAVKP